MEGTEVGEPAFRGNMVARREVLAVVLVAGEGEVVEDGGGGGAGTARSEGRRGQRARLSWRMKTPMSRYAREVRKRSTSRPSLMRLTGLAKDGGELASMSCRVGRGAGAPAAATEAIAAVMLALLRASLSDQAAGTSIEWVLVARCKEGVVVRVECGREGETGLG